MPDFQKKLGALLEEDAPAPSEGGFTQKLGALLEDDAVPPAEERIGRGAEMPVQEITAQAPAEGEAVGRGLAAPVKPAAWYSRFLKGDDLNNLPPEKKAQLQKEAADFAKLAAPGGAAKNFAANTAAMMQGAGSGVASSAALGAVQGATARAADDPNATAGDVLGSGAVSGLVAGGMSALGTGLAGAANGWKDKADRLMTNVFMSPAQRAALQSRKGSEALTELGANAQEAGLFKPRNWLDYLRPATARRVADNAETAMATQGPRIAQLEDKISATANPQVQISPIAQGLRDQAAEANAITMDKGAPRDAQHLVDLADMMEQPQTATVTGEATSYPNAINANPVPPLPQKPPRVEPEQLPMLATPGPAPVMPSRNAEQLSLPLQPVPEQLSLPVGSAAQTELPFAQTTLPKKVPFSPSNPKQGTLAEANPANAAEWKGPKPAVSPPVETAQTRLPGVDQTGFNFPLPPARGPFTPFRPQGLKGQQASLGVEDKLVTPLEGTAQISRTEMPLKEALANKRYVANKINWQGNPNATASEYGEQAGRKYTWAELKDAIGRSLEAEGAKNPAVAKDVADLMGANKTYSTAATAFDPALKMAERNGEVGLSLSDLMLGAAAGGGPTGLGAAAAKSATRGAGAAMAAGAARGFGKASAAGGLANTPAAINAAIQAGTPRAEAEKAANSDLKRQLAEDQQ